MFGYLLFYIILFTFYCIYIPSIRLQTACPAHGVSGGLQAITVYIEQCD